MKKIGMRNIKTALSVFIVVVTLQMFSNITKYPTTGFFGGAAAVFTLQNTMNKTFKFGIGRIFGSLIGAVVALIFIYIEISIPSQILNDILIFIGMVIIIYICSIFNLQQGVMAASVIFLAGMALGTDKYFQYTIIRTFEISYGVIVAIIINKYLYPHNENK